ncbi:MAG: hypothetical protein ACI86X_000511 [Moritella sp.]|jgi:hypothetical protein
MLISFFIGITLVVFIKQKAKHPNTDSSIIVLIGDGYKALIADIQKLMKN